MRTRKKRKVKPEGLRIPFQTDGSLAYSAPSNGSGPPNAKQIRTPAALYSDLPDEPPMDPELLRVVHGAWDELKKTGELTLQANRFLLVGDDGTVRAVMSSHKDDVTLSMFDPAGNLRLKIGVFAGGLPALDMYSSVEIGDVSVETQSVPANAADARCAPNINLTGGAAGKGNTNADDNQMAYANRKETARANGNRNGDGNQNTDAHGERNADGDYNADGKRSPDAEGIRNADAHRDHGPGGNATATGRASDGAGGTQTADAASDRHGDGGGAGNRNHDGNGSRNGDSSVDPVAQAIANGRKRNSVPRISLACVPGLPEDPASVPMLQLWDLTGHTQVTLAAEPGGASWLTFHENGGKLPVATFHSEWGVVRPRAGFPGWPPLEGSLSLQDLCEAEEVLRLIRIGSNARPERVLVALDLVYPGLAL